jgi:hypothetical protein
MFEGSGADLDEYFVPIVIKCVGDPDQLAGELGPNGRARLDQLKKDYPEFYAGQSATTWKSYWEKNRSGSKMNTAGHKGYFKILIEEWRGEHRQAVLLGYSQGGVVARFLAWMDENLWRVDNNDNQRPEADKGALIAGVITVQAPNRGSPLASPSNGDNVIHAVFGAITSIAGFPPDANPQLAAALWDLTRGELHQHDASNICRGYFDVETLVSLIEAALKDTISGSAKEETLFTAKKWLSGMEALDHPTAFSALQTARLNHPGRVLELIQHIDNTYQGAVIGTNNSLKDFLGLNSWFSPASWLAMGAGLSGPLQKIETQMNLAMAEARPREGGQGVLDGEARRVAELYRNGATICGESPGATINLSPDAHDFVIPSVMQAIGPVVVSGGVPQSPPRFLGNIDIPTTHISGDKGAVAKSRTLLKKLSSKL